MDKMDPEELERGLAALGVSSYRFAKIIGMPDRTVRSWVAGEYPIQPPTAALVRLAVRLRIKPERLAKLVTEAL